MSQLLQLLSVHLVKQRYNYMYLWFHLLVFKERNRHRFMKVFTQCLHGDLMLNIYLIFDSSLWKTLNSSNWENLQGFLKWVFAKAKKGIDFTAQPCLLMWHTFLNRHLFTVQTAAFCEDVLTVWMYSMLSSAQFSSDRSNNQSYLTCQIVVLCRCLVLFLPL